MGKISTIKNIEAQHIKKLDSHGHIAKCTKQQKSNSSKYNSIRNPKKYIQFKKVFGKKDFTLAQLPI